jgi:hypothetical protein
MSKLNLPIDILTINTVDTFAALRTIQHCNKFFNFNNNFIISNNVLDVDNINFIKVKKFGDIQEYSEYVLRLSEIVESDHVLIVQDDGFILNPQKWKHEFLSYDYIGAPWPSSKKWVKRFKKYGDYTKIKKNIKENRVGNGGFSLRSRKFLEYSADFESCNGMPEDIFLSLINYKEALRYGINFAPFEIAKLFSLETPLGGYKNKNELRSKKINTSEHFGFHGKRFDNSQEIMDRIYK